MKKNVIMIALVIISIISIIYGQFQKTEANRQRELAWQNAKLAQEMAEKARIALDQAEKARLIAEQQLAIAVEQSKLAAERTDQLLKQNKKSK